MNLQIRIVAIADSGQQQVYEIAFLQRTDLKMETLGLTLAEGKTILREIQRVVVERQVAECLEPYRHSSRPATGAPIPAPAPAPAPARRDATANQHGFPSSRLRRRRTVSARTSSRP
jgi:hypothetical protein